MNRELLKNYFITSLLYIIFTILFFLYVYFRVYIKGSGMDTLFASMGYAGIIVAGFFLVSKTWGRIFPQLNSWQGVVASAKTVGLAAIFVNLIIYWLLPLNVNLYGFFQSTPLISLPVIILLLTGISILVLYSDRLIQSRFPNLWPKLKYWEVFGVLLFLLLLTIVDGFPNWINWFNKYILNLDSSISKSPLPPPPLLTTIYGLVTLLIYLWGYFTGSENANTTPPTTQPEVTLVPQVPTQSSPTPIVPPTPATPPPTPNTPQNIPPNTGMGTGGAV